MLFSGTYLLYLQYMELLNGNEWVTDSDSGGMGNVVSDISCCTIPSCPVITRAQAKAGVEPLPDLDGSLIEKTTKEH